MTLPTQAAVMRAVKAALEPARKMGLTASGYKVSFVQGVPCVDVTLGAESPLPAPGKPEGINVQDFQEALRSRHASRRP